MNFATLIITNHAWGRFVTRWEGAPPPCFMEALREVILSAKEEDIGAGATLRLMANKMDPARYFASGPWRLVTTEDAKCLITVERIIHKKRAKKKRGRTPKRLRKAPAAAR